MINPPLRTRRTTDPVKFERQCRLLDKNIDVRGEDECWPWLGAINQKGYGYVSTTVDMEPMSFSAHRAAFEREYGYLSKMVRHSCDNPPCCNPKHLLGGTQLDNMRDRKERGRWHGLPREKNGRAVLNEEQVAAIISDPRRQIDIAADYGISQGHVSGLKLGKYQWVSCNPLHLLDRHDT